MARTNIRGTQVLDGSIDLSLDTSGILPEAKGGTGTTSLSAAAAVAEKIAGPGSSTDGRIAVFDGTTGKLLKEVPVTIGPSGSMTVANLDLTRLRTLAVTRTGNTTLTTDSHTMELLDATGGDFTITLATFPTGASGVHMWFKRVDSTAATVTFANGTFNDGSINPSLGPKEWIHIVTSEVSGTWLIVGGSNTGAVAADDPYRFDSTKLRAARAAMAKVDTTPVDILIVSDSWGAGSGAGAPVYGVRWSEKLQDRLRNHINPPLVYGGIGYRESYTFTPNTGTVFTYAGTTTTSAAVGLGRKAVRMNNGATATFTVPGTAVDILYGKGGLATSFTWKINSGSATSVDATNGGVIAPGVLRIGAAQGLAPGDTITITSTGNYTYFEGAMFYDGDESAGIRVWNGSTSGYRAFDFVDAGASSYGSWGTVDPDLVIMDLGGNEFTGGGVGTANVRTPAQMKASLKEVLTQIRAKCSKPPSVIFLVKPPLPLPGGVTNPDPFSAYRDKMFEFVKEDGQITVIDHQDLFGPTAFTGTDTYGVTSGDTFHPGPAGYTMIADAIAEVILGNKSVRNKPRPRIIPTTTTLHSSQIALMPDTAQIIRYTP
jgi:lysophospholipase L1-like esterase